MLTLGSASKGDLIEIFQHLTTLDQAGVPLDTALDALIHSSFSAKTVAALTNIRNQLQTGASFSEALASHAQTFPPFISQIIAVGENAGNLAPSFSEIEVYLRWQERVHGQLKRALRYGAIMLTLIAFMIVATITILLPQIEGFLTSLGNEGLPLPTRLLLAFSKIFTLQGLLLPSLMILSLAVFFFLRPARLCIIPLVGSLIQSEAALHYLKSLSTLLNARVGLLVALHQAQETVPFTFLRKRLSSVPDLLASGLCFSDVLAQQKIFSPLVLRLIRLGEQTGRLCEMTQQAATWCQQSHTQQVENIVRKIHPFFVIILGTLILWIISAILLPLYQNIGTLP